MLEEKEEMANKYFELLKRMKEAERGKKENSDEQEEVSRKYYQVLLKNLRSHCPKGKSQYKGFWDVVLSNENNKEFARQIRRAGVEKYLEEHDYKKVLLRKWKQHVYKDEYGNKREENFVNEVRLFVAKRDPGAIDICTSKLIPKTLHKSSQNSFCGSQKVEGVFFGIREEETYQEGNLPYSICKEERDKETRKRKHKIYIKNQEIRKENQAVLDTLVSDICYLINLEASKEENQEEYEPVATEQSQESDNNPYEYERKIGRKFELCGWTSTVTKSSGDQGADVIIEKGEHRGVVQCKLYSQPVGNKAVQEVHAAKGFYDANFATVVTNQDFTPSARMLATKLNVHLVHESEIRLFSELF